MDSGNDQDLDQTFVPAIDIIVIDQSETFAQELRLVSEDDRSLRWVAGVSRGSTRTAFRSLGTTFLGTVVPPAAQDLKLQDFAVFGNLSYDLSDDLELTLGLPLGRGNARGYDAGPQAHVQRTATQGVSIAYSFGEGLLGYVTVGKGFRAGGFNNLAPGSNFHAGL